jgi:phosphatidylserine/phosphatidylglycerophosphate/cardiolipin synthase-like enzyme
MNRLSPSRLYNQDTFYRAFLSDVRHANRRVIIESPFMTSKRMAMLLPVFQNLRKRGIEIIVNTKPFDELEPTYRLQAMKAVGAMQNIGVYVLLTSGHHRKIAIIDADILYEGSLNILSQNDSCELMRRMRDESLVKEMLRFTNLKKWCK